MSFADLACNEAYFHDALMIYVLAVLACVAYFHSLSAQPAAPGDTAAFQAILATDDYGLKLKVVS